MSSSLRLYRRLASRSWPRTYEGKILALAFLCVHVPLLALLVFVMLTSTPWAVAWPGLLAVLLATLAGTTLMMGGLHGLLSPVRLTSAALARYQRDQTLPALPTHFEDEAGQLMRHTSESIHTLHGLLQMRQRMLGVISHDLRTPLATVQLAADLMTEELGQQPPDKALLAELATAIHAAVQEAFQLTSSVLDTAEAEHNIALRPETITSADLLGRLAASVRFIAQQKRVRVIVDDQAHARLTVDRVKVQQVLTNFTTNAIKFTPPEGEVRLSAHVRDEEIVFEVADTGVGFGAEQAADLFNAFTRQHTRGTEGEPGHGLGLWIAKTFAERLGGQVEASSVPGAGSTFRLRLPHDSVALVYRLPRAA